MGAPLVDVEAAVRRALVGGDDRGLRVLGYGEISLVVGWPADGPRWAAKRLPPFASHDAAARYERLFSQYLDRLRQRGVVPVESTFGTVAGAGLTRRDPAHVVGYVCQPVLAEGSLAPAVLGACEPDPEHPVLAAICRAVPAVVDERTGFDGQLSNWAVVDGELRYLDVTTPMLFDTAGAIELDTGVFLAAYPWLLRAPIDRVVVPDVVGAYRDPRHVLVDLAANLLKERLEHWLAATLRAVNQVVDAPVTEDEVRRYYRADARLWEAMLRLRRADRWWQRHLRRRPYPFLLPGPVRR